jgi:hypothetical protein
VDIVDAVDTMASAVIKLFMSLSMMIIRRSTTSGALVHISVRPSEL